MRDRMLPHQLELSRGTVTIREAGFEDIDALTELNRRCYPSEQEGGVVWNRGQLHEHLRRYPEGQWVAEVGGRVVGAISSLVHKSGADPYRPHTFAGATDGGYFHNHDPEGDTLYCADVYVDPEWRGMGIARALLQVGRELCRARNLRRMLAASRLFDYASTDLSLSPEGYVRAVEEGLRRDEVLSLHLQEGFVVRGVLRNYVRDPRSRNCAALMEWLNLDYRPGETTSERKVRVACVQYQVHGLASFQNFAAQVEYFVDAAAGYRSDFVLFPELFTMQLLSQEGLRRLPSRDAILRLSELEAPFVELMSRLAREYGLHVVAGSHPIQRQGRLYNTCFLFFPDGRHVLQPKLHITPAEKRDWGITGGHELRVISTAKARVGILVCYDAEFPETARHLADLGAEVLFVPYCTDTRAGYLRVRYCCQARAIDNQVYVATAGIIGNLPSVEAMDINYGRAAVYAPSDFEFARDGIQAQADSNVEMLLVTDLDIGDLYRSRAAGSVTPRLDRRTDLFEYRCKLAEEPELGLEAAPPMDPMDYVEVPAAVSDHDPSDP